MKEGEYMVTKKCKKSGKMIHVCRCDYCLKDWEKIRDNIEKIVEDIKTNGKRNDNEEIDF